MGKYTVHPEKYDGQLEKAFHKVVDVVIRTVGKDDLVSVVLFGGFGKGEGSAEIVKGKIVPFNDFDFYVIIRKGATEELSEMLTEKASKEIGAGGLDFVEHPGEKYDPKRFFHADIRCIDVGDLPRLRKTQRTFELKHASQVIWGDKGVLGAIKDVEGDELPLPEGIRPMLNKMDTLLLCMDQKKLKGEMEEDDRRIMIFYSMKALMTCAEALLILSGRFRPTYRQRSEEFKKTFGKDFPELAEKLPRLSEKVGKATEFKLRPDFPVVKDPLALWFDARDCLGTVFRHVISRYLSLESDSWEEIAESFHKRMPHVYFRPYLEEMLENRGLPKSFARVMNPLQYYLNVLYARKLKESGEFSLRPLLGWRDVGLKLAVPLFLFLFSIRKDGTSDKRMLELSRKYLGKVKGVGKDLGWEDLRKRILYLYGLYYLQKLI
jgi:hypothetical protein